MLRGIKQQVVVGKDGKIEIQTSELAEGMVVEVNDYSRSSRSAQGID